MDRAKSVKRWIASGAGLWWGGDYWSKVGKVAPGAGASQMGLFARVQTPERVSDKVLMVDTALAVLRSHRLLFRAGRGR